jgi:hypothetical protein
MSTSHNKVIGYFAYVSPTTVVCTGEACIIAGSRHAMEEYLLEIDPDRGKLRTIKKTTFDEIKRGLLLGAAYAFDKGSYRRFYPLAKQAGLGVMDADFEKQRAEGRRFLIIQLKGS